MMLIADDTCIPQNARRPARRDRYIREGSQSGVRQTPGIQSCLFIIADNGLLMMSIADDTGIPENARRPARCDRYIGEGSQRGWRQIDSGHSLVVTQILVVTVLVNSLLLSTKVRNLLNYGRTKIECGQVLTFAPTKVRNLLNYGSYVHSGTWYRTAVQVLPRSHQQPPST